MKHENLTKSELAALLRVTTRTINNYIYTGKVPPPLKPGRKALWNREHLLTFLRQQETRSALKVKE